MEWNTQMDHNFKTQSHQTAVAPFLFYVHEGKWEASECWDDNRDADLSFRDGWVPSPLTERSEAIQAAAENWQGRGETGLGWGGGRVTGNEGAQHFPPLWIISPSNSQYIVDSWKTRWQEWL